MVEFKLGRVPSVLDIQDYDLSKFVPGGLRAITLANNMEWDFPSFPLDQGETNHCVGYSGATWRINLPTYTPQTNTDGERYYYMAKEFDGEPGNEDGSCVRSLAKSLKRIGAISGYAFAPTMAIIRWWIINKGPMVMGTDWTLDMFLPNKDNVVRPTGMVVGGHAYVVNAWTSDNRLRIQNSWGTAWGKNGSAWISADDFAILFRHGGEAMASVEIEPKEKKKWFWFLS